MWTSERRLERRAEESAALGQVTLGGDPAGVFLGGERRNRRSPVIQRRHGSDRRSVDQRTGA